ncbi:MAG: hypothetical protein GY757_24895 [bacterium]|nr:hypothetical protein [bacterium]
MQHNDESGSTNGNNGDAGTPVPVFDAQLISDAHGSDSGTGQSVEKKKNAAPARPFAYKLGRTVGTAAGLIGVLTEIAGLFQLNKNNATGSRFNSKGSTGAGKKKRKRTKGGSHA